jgi:3-methylcrotonyl-CoA carboxylase alpha subunit
MFKKILVANRGEIACRIIDTINKLGIKSVAVFSDVDTNAKHVELANEAINIGAARADESYLNGDKIIKVALKVGAEAIHPGYGFLSENADFAKAIELAGLSFIGPSSSSIELMGLKDKSKSLMAQSNIPVLPGYDGKNQNDNFLASKAKKIGYPVIIKAVAGGGGKGMRMVEYDYQFLESLNSARSEALNAFGDNRIMIEKYVPKPRHIEVQIFGDQHENIVHLHERDCSLQRRYQKIIEEAPASNISEEIRNNLLQAAIAVGKAVNYVGAGTVEFICECRDDNSIKDFWFMEMNTRLQVEHPITEMITGLDLVEWQIMVAAGKTLPLKQNEIIVEGHSIEARLYAEDPSNQFLPTIGLINHLSFPSDVRVDSGVRVNDEITEFYDPLIAKIIVHSSNRQLAIKEIKEALCSLEVSGVVTNINFLLTLFNHKSFKKAQFDTQLIERELPIFSKEIKDHDKIKALAAIVALDLSLEKSVRVGFTLWGALKREVRLNTGSVFVTILDINNFLIDFNNKKYSVRRDGWTINNEITNARFIKLGRQISIFYKGSWNFSLVDNLNPEVDTNSRGDKIVAPMPGFIKAISVNTGDKIKEGESLIVQEAMKMEHTLVSEIDGVVKSINIRVNDQVEAGTVLINIDEFRQKQKENEE